MNKPILVVMAAGLGSRYGGLKQMDAIGNNGEWMIDYSLYDAYRAGFRQVVFIVREEILEDFQITMEKRVGNRFEVAYAVQRLDDIPEKFVVPESRTKPWGTGHAVYSARKEIGDHSFMVINADDYYGPEAFQKIYNSLSDTQKQDRFYEYSMVGYQLQNTVTDNGHVARGICVVSDENYLIEITERTRIEKRNNEICYTENQGEQWCCLPPETPVSLNCWGFHSSLLREMEEDFPLFLNQALCEKPETAEYFLPSVVERLLLSKKAKVQVLPSCDCWYGVTYQEDKEKVSNALNGMKDSGVYPHDLWK